MNEEEIFQVAAEMSAAERAAYLLIACEGQPALRQRVERLLASHDDGGFMQRSSDRHDSAELEAELARFKPEEGEDRIGNYKLLQKIGEGGFGTVWMAEQFEPVRRRVALKIIKPGMDTKEVLVRFEQERQALALMDHPNIAKVLDAGVTPLGRPFFVMELVRGIRITDFCDQNNLPTAERLALFIAVCNAIQHAHQKGIIHRDIKPSNILVTLHDGVPVPKVIDFGVAKAIQSQRLTDLTFFTRFEQMIGTPLYMSPEQAEMSGLDIDTRSDIYSLGVLLYELLTGTTPFDAKELMALGIDAMRKTIRERQPVRPSTQLTQQLVAATRMRNAESPDAERRTQDSALRIPNSALAPASSRRLLQIKELVHQLKGDLDWIVMKCLEKDRARRYETANGLARDIERHLNNEPVVARPPSNLYRLQKAIRRHKTAFVTSGVVTIASVLALVSLVVTNVRITREKNQKDVALRDKGTALESSRASEQRAREQLFSSLRNQARASRYSRQPGQRFDSLSALTEAAQIRREEGLRDEVIASLAVPDIRAGTSWDAGINVTQLIAFDHLYQRYARISEEGVISVRRVPDDQEIRRIQFKVPLESKAGQGLWFSKSGKFLGFLDRAHTVRIWNLADGESVLAEPPENCWGISFSPDERYLTVSQADWVLRFDLSRGEETNRWRVHSKPHFLAFHSDNRKLAVGYEHSTMVSVYDTLDGTLLADLPIGNLNAPVIAWHPDGKRLAIAGDDPRIQIWDLDSKQTLARLVGHAELVTGLTFHPDGSLLASGSSDGVLRLWDPASGRQLIQMPIGAAIHFSTDGRRLGHVWARDGRVQLLEVAPCPEYRTLVSDLGAGRDLYLDGDISPDGRLLALGMPDGVRLWELSTGCELAFLPLGLSCSAFFLPDGDDLITCGPVAGLRRWTFAGGAGAAELRLGPPFQIPLPFRVPLRASRSSNGHTIAVISEQRGEALLLDWPQGPCKAIFCRTPAAVL